MNKVLYGRATKDDIEKLKGQFPSLINKQAREFIATSGSFEAAVALLAADRRRKARASDGGKKKKTKKKKTKKKKNKKIKHKTNRSKRKRKKRRTLKGGAETPHGPLSSSQTANARYKRSMQASAANPLLHHAEDEAEQEQEQQPKRLMGAAAAEQEEDQDTPERREAAGEEEQEQEQQPKRLMGVAEEFALSEEFEPFLEMEARAKELEQAEQQREDMVSGLKDDVDIEDRYGPGFQFPARGEAARGSGGEKGARGVRAAQLRTAYTALRGRQDDYAARAALSPYTINGIVEQAESQNSDVPMASLNSETRDRVLERQRELEMERLNLEEDEEDLESPPRRSKTSALVAQATEQCTAGTGAMRTALADVNAALDAMTLAAKEEGVAGGFCEEDESPGGSDQSDHLLDSGREPADLAAASTPETGKKFSEETLSLLRGRSGRLDDLLGQVGEKTPPTTEELGAMLKERGLA